jgi:hypothetical protein
MKKIILDLDNDRVAFLLNEYDIDINVIPKKGKFHTEDEVRAYLIQFLRDKKINDILK